MNLNDTIAAIATAHGVGAIAVIRISGEDAIEICDKIFVSPKNKKLADAKTHTIHFGKLVSCGKTVDEVLVSVFRAPFSYTGENSVEISCHGGILVSKKVLEAVISAGCRLAEAGEFTKRAFLNGKLDLSQAEGVIDVINAESTPALSLSVNQLGGAISKEITKIRENLLSVITQINAAIDYPEEDVEELTNAQICEKLSSALAKIKALADSADNGRFLRDGIDTAIVGKPNVGKSSLLNVLLGEDRAIVTDIAGTTRDVISEKLVLGNVVLNIYDTAGIRDTEDKIESFGIDKSKECIEKSELILFVVDASGGITADDEEIFKLCKDKKVLVIANKTDLNKENIDFDAPVIYISAKERDGIDKISQKIEEMFEIGKIKASNNDVVVSLRHKAALCDAFGSIETAFYAIKNNTPIDMASIDIVNAISSLGEISGQTVSEEIIQNIFASFCVGK